MLDAHHLAGFPIGDRHHVRGGQRTDPREALELGADARLRLRTEHDGYRVGHPLHMAVDVLHLGPHQLGSGPDSGAQVDRETHEATAAGSTSRSRAAASTEGTVFTKMPVPISKPATTEVRGSTSACQWNSRAPRPGGAVWITTLYAGAPSSTLMREIA